MSNAIDSRPPEGTHCDGGRTDVQLDVYSDQLRKGKRYIHKPAEIERTQGDRTILDSGSGMRRTHL
jgi:hypothetical protein